MSFIDFKFFCSVVVLLERTLALKNNVATQSVSNREPELRLVEYVLLRFEVDQDGLGQILALLSVLRNWWHAQTLWHVPER